MKKTTTRKIIFVIEYVPRFSFRISCWYFYIVTIFIICFWLISSVSIEAVKREILIPIELKQYKIKIDFFFFEERVLNNYVGIIEKKFFTD